MMIADLHSLIGQFLSAHTVEPLAAIAPPVQVERYIKAGVVPFIATPAGYRYYMMKPAARRRELDLPPFQLGKGTRMYCPDGQGWRDMRDKGAETHCETLLQTGLREGIEELGLRLTNICTLYDAGPYRFASASSGKPKHMWLYAAHVHSPDDFLPASQIESSTADRSWLSLNEFMANGRVDQQYILRDIEARIAALPHE
jgi:hypothetical protein